MHTKVIDFESFYSTEFSLSKISTLQYVRDPRFKAYGASIKDDDLPTFWVDGPDLRDYFESVDWPDIAAISHNSNFDLSVLYQRYGKSPARRIDTLGLCRALLSHDLDFDLDTICKLLGIPGKLEGGAVLDEIKGVRDPSNEQLARLADYAVGDSESCYGLYKLLWPELPQFERDFMDLIIRISTEGSFVFEPTMAEEVEQAIHEDRRSKLETIGLTVNSEGKVPQLNSRPQFAELLRSRGVEPPTKISYTKTHPEGKETWAFSKQDPDFLILRENPDVADLIEAKLVWASNNAITRAQSLAQCGRLGDGTIPVYLNYSGAHTHRLSGGGKLNMQNLNARGPNAKIRKALKAPKGYKILVRDSSQIELRINMLFSGQMDVVQALRNGGDPYKKPAAAFYRMLEEEIQKPSKERDFGKVIALACGYGMGPPKFRATCAVGPMGADPIYLSTAEAQQAVWGYRSTHHNVKASWDWLGSVGLATMGSKNGRQERGPVVLEYEAISLPGGLTLKYPNLEPTEDGWTWGINGVHHRTYGGILQENIVQYLAAIVIKEMMLAADQILIANDWGIVIHQVHDEIICLVREDAVNEADAALEKLMNTPPTWWPELPLGSEGDSGDSYGDCK